MGLFFVGLAGVVIWALSQGRGGGGGPLPEPGPDQVLFEGRYWTPNELRGEMRRRLAQTPTDRTSMAYYAVAMDFGRDVTVANNHGFLAAVNALRLQDKDVATLDSWLAAMREIGIAGESSYKALAYYVSTRQEAALVDPYAADRTAAALDRARAQIPEARPEELEATAAEVEADAPEVAETLRDVAEARRAVEAQVPAPAPEPLPNRTLDYAAMSTQELGAYSALHMDDAAAWAEVDRRLRAAPTANLSAVVAPLQATVANQALTADARAYAQRMLDLTQAELARRAPTVTATVETVGPVGYDPAAARGEAPALASALRRAPYASTTIAKVRSFQGHAFGTAHVDGKYGGGTRGALRYYGVADPPVALYRPTAEVAYAPPA